MPILILIAVCCATIFFRAADYEGLNPWIWSTASLGLTAISVLRNLGAGSLLLFQVGLFALLWWWNVRRKGGSPPQGRAP